LTSGVDKDLDKIQTALALAGKAVSVFTPGKIAAERKAGGDPVTEADIVIDNILKQALLAPDDGWLSEETVDDLSRLDKRRVWIVDSIDGTREFVEGIPEWCISIGLVVDGRPKAGGIYNPQANQLFLGALEVGTFLNGRNVRVSDKASLEKAKILASRSELRKGLWKPFETAPFEIIPMGSVAYKLACVSAGLADGTISLAPKNEWDVAAGIALVLAAGGQVDIKDDSGRLFNRRDTLMAGLTAGAKPLCVHIRKMMHA